MKKYEKPIVMINDDLAEGVYAASGTGPMGTSDCWTYNIYPVQEWDGANKVFEMALTHHTGLEHISGATTISVTFNTALTSANSEFSYSYAGNTITVTRTLLADAYKDGDEVTYKIWASTGDEVTTKALTVTNVTVACDKQINVQGGGAGEINP